MSCHHTITFCTTSICQPNNLCTMVLKLFANIIPSFLCNLHQVVLFIFFSFYLFLCAMLFCHHYIFAMFIFVLSTSLCYSFFFFYLFMWALLVIIILFSPCSFSSSFRLLTNRVSFLLKFYMTLQHVFHNMSRDFLSKRMASSLGSGLTSVQLLHTFLFSFVEFLNWNFAFKRI